MENLSFIKNNFSWDHPNTPNLFAQLKSSDITLDDVMNILCMTKEEFDLKMSEHPILKDAYELGEEYIEKKVHAKMLESAMKGSYAAQKYWLDNFSKKNKALATKMPITGDDPLEEIERATDAKEISLAMRKRIAKQIAMRIESDELSGSDLIKLMGMVNDRVDGRVAETIQADIRTMNFQKIEVEFV